MTHETHTSSPTTTAPARSTTPLWISALVLATLLGVQLLRPAGQAHAEVVSRAGSFVGLTAEAGNEEVLVVLDERSETVMVYRTDLRQGILLMQKVPLEQLFRDARTKSAGTP